MGHQLANRTAATSLGVDPGPIATAIGQPHRAAILVALLDGRPHTAADLAATIGIPPSTATAHLHRLIEANLVAAHRSGRFRLHQIIDPAVARLVEALVALAPPVPITSLIQSTAAQAHREARSCYDHLAGKLGVRITEGLAAAEAIRYEEPEPAERAGSIPTPITLGPRADDVFATFGVDVASVRAGAGRRPPLRLCIDWSERRPHLAGAVGAAMLTALLQQHWVRPGKARALTLTPNGSDQLDALIGPMAARTDNEATLSSAPQQLRTTS